MIVLPPEGKIVPVEPFVIECRAFLAGSIVTEIKKNGKYPQCTFTFWQQRQQIEFCQMFWSLTFDRNFSINDRHFPIRKRFDKI